MDPAIDLPRPSADTRALQQEPLELTIFGGRLLLSNSGEENLFQQQRQLKLRVWSFARGAQNLVQARVQDHVYKNSGS
jgi:hypothetical protein